jgi:hypothetical protein
MPIGLRSFALGLAMVKETKFVRQQAAKAERMRGPPSDTEIAQNFLNIEQA